jgi:hypothetical protein
MGKQSDQNDNPLAVKMAELGLVAGEDGQVSIKMLNTVSIGDFSGNKDESCSCDPLTAVRMVERRYAEPAAAVPGPESAAPANEPIGGSPAAEVEPQSGGEDGECSQAE